jgi:hypothetical protein
MTSITGGLKRNVEISVNSLNIIALRNGNIDAEDLPVLVGTRRKDYDRLGMLESAAACFYGLLADRLHGLRLGLRGFSAASDRIRPIDACLPIDRVLWDGRVSIMG